MHSLLVAAALASAVFAAPNVDRRSCHDKGDDIAIAQAYAPVMPAAVAPVAIAPMTQGFGGKKGFRREADHDVERRSCHDDGFGYGGYGDKKGNGFGGVLPVAPVVAPAAAAPMAIAPMTQGKFRRSCDDGFGGYGHHDKKGNDFGGVLPVAPVAIAPAFAPVMPEAIAPMHHVAPVQAVAPQVAPVITGKKGNIEGVITGGPVAVPEAAAPATHYGGHGGHPGGFY